MSATSTAFGQTSPPPQPTAQPTATAPAKPPVYKPTSLALEPGVPRTTDGHPDLQGVVWNANFFPVFEIPQANLPLVLPEAQAKTMHAMGLKAFLSSKDPNTRIDPEVGALIGGTDGLPIVRHERRTRLVVLPADGKVPFTPEARAEVKAYDWMKLPSNNPEERPDGERCLQQGAQPPLAFTISLFARHFVQSPGYVVIHTEYGDEARIVAMTDKHRPLNTSTRLGDSIGRWDDDTLVVETTNFTGSERLRNVPSLILGRDSKVIERFTRVSPDELLYQFTIEDPKLYAAPWLGEYSLYRSKELMFPSNCHEGNHSLGNVLSAQRVADRAATSAGATPAKTPAQK